MIPVCNNDFAIGGISYQQERRQLVPCLNLLLIALDMPIADPEQ